MIGRTIVIEINIDGPRWANGSFDEEMRHFLNHVQASMHMWNDEGWQDKLLMGTDRMPTGMMRFHHGHKIDGLPERSAVDAVLVEEVRRKIVDSLTVSAAADTTPGGSKARNRRTGAKAEPPQRPTMQSPDLGKLPSAAVKGGRIVVRQGARKGRRK